jgi:hypothetical protein
MYKSKNMARSSIDLTLILIILSIILTLCAGQNVDQSGENVSAYQDWDLFIENGLWLYDGATIITPPPTIDGLVLYLTFDQRQNLDQSGNGNHATNTSTKGPGLFLTQGYSARFQGEQNIQVPANDQINSALAGQYSMSFWIFINAFNTLTTEQCNIIEKGDQDSSAFAFTIEMSSRSIMITTQTEVGPQTLTSNARILSQRWTHISLFKTNGILVLYVNGNLDSVIDVQPSDTSPSHPLYIGRMPWQDYIGSGCTLDFFIDEFKLWNKRIDESWIEAESGIALGAGTDPHSIELGCLNWDFNSAYDACTDEYHLCTTVEIYSFAFAAAKSMGWMSSGQRLWSDRSTEQDSEDLGLAVCCRNY